MNNRLFTCLNGTVLDVSKITAVHPIRDENKVLGCNWVYTVRLPGGDLVYIGSEDKKELVTDYNRLIEAWKSNGRT